LCDFFKEKDELHQRKLDELRGEIQIGVEEADRGELSPLNARGTLKRMRATRAKKGK
jgi:hypothetical protein